MFSIHILLFRTFKDCNSKAPLSVPVSRRFLPPPPPSRHHVMVVTVGTTVSVAKNSQNKRHRQFKSRSTIRTRKTSVSSVMTSPRATSLTRTGRNLLRPGWKLDQVWNGAMPDKNKNSFVPAEWSVVSPEFNFKFTFSAVIGWTFGVFLQHFFVS